MEKNVLSNLADELLESACGSTKDAHTEDISDSDSIVIKNSDLSNDSADTKGSNITWPSKIFTAPSTVSALPSYPTHLKLNRPKKKGEEEEKLNTIQGVLLPCTSQILGVIFFLRLPTITAQAGTIGATVIILVCVLSTFITSLSLSAIATNGTIRAGGPYYIISRTLGVGIGGSLGLLFYLGTTLGASMYILGAVEAFRTNLEDYGPPPSDDQEDDAVVDDDEDVFYDYEPDEPDPWFGPSQIASVSLTFLLTFVVSVGMKYVNLSANFFLVTVLFSIACILVGGVLFAIGIWDGSLAFEDDRVFNYNMWPNFTPDPQTKATPTFFSLMALFYPSVTGIMAGTNRSANLATPNKSIPLGTIGAILITSLLYVCQVWLLGMVVSHQTLIEDKLVVASIAFPSSFVVQVGIITACVGAALQCMTGAPQLLAAIATDDAIPILRFVKPETEGVGVSRQESQPKVAIWVTCLIASLATLGGNLDYITPIVTMFFLLMYGGINLCCFLMGWVNAPGFRPTFKYFHKTVSLFGFVWCLGMALVINWLNALCAIILFLILYMNIYKEKRDTDSNDGNDQSIGFNWGDVGDSIRYKLTTSILMTITKSENFHPKNWRLQLLTVVDTDDFGHPLSKELLALAAQLKKGRGVNMVVSIKRGSMINPGAFDASQDCRRVLKKHMVDEGMKGFAAVSVTNERFSEAVWSAVNHSGMGPISPNTVLLPWMKDWRDHPVRAQALVDAINGTIKMKRAVVLFKGSSLYPKFGEIVVGGIIDVYWVVEDGGLPLLLPFLLTKHKIWRRGVMLRVFAVATNIKEDPELLEKEVIEHLRCVRIEASVRVVDMSHTSLEMDMREQNSNDEHTRGWQRRTVSEAFSIEGSSPFKVENDPENGLFRATSLRPVMQGYDGSSKEEGESRMHSASLFNQAIRFQSSTSNLVVTNMPLVESFRDYSEFCEYIDTMSRNVENMILVRGVGNEVVTAIA